MFVSTPFENSTFLVIHATGDHFFLQFRLEKGGVLAELSEKGNDFEIARSTKRSNLSKCEQLPQNNYNGRISDKDLTLLTKEDETASDWQNFVICHVWSQDIVILSARPIQSSFRVRWDDESHNFLVLPKAIWREGEKAIAQKVNRINWKHKRNKVIRTFQENRKRPQETEWS